jgi:hypothetical protein
MAGKLNLHACIKAVSRPASNAIMAHERADAGRDTQRDTVAIAVEVLADIGQVFAEGKRANGACVLNHLDAAEDVALSVGESLALFARDGLGNLTNVVLEQLLVLEQDGLAGQDRGLLPGLEGLPRRAHQ